MIRRDLIWPLDSSSTLLLSVSQAYRWHHREKITLAKECAYHRLGPAGPRTWMPVQLARLSLYSSEISRNPAVPHVQEDVEKPLHSAILIPLMFCTALFLLFLTEIMLFAKGNLQSLTYLIFQIQNTSFFHSYLILVTVQQKYNDELGWWSFSGESLTRYTLATIIAAVVL